MRGLLLCVIAAGLQEGCGCSENIIGDAGATDTTTETDGDLTGDRDCGDCNDDDPCTVDSCDTVTGECAHDLLDLDGDGHSPYACGGDDCDDERTDVYLGAPEVCLDGVDQDCDTLVDGPRAMLSTVHLKTVSTGASPSIAWTGSEFAVAWYDFPFDIYLGRVGLDGELEDDPVQLTEIEQYIDPSIAWTGSELGVTFYNVPPVGSPYNTINFMRVNPLGDLIGDMLRLNDVDTWVFNPKIVWTGSEFGLMWEDGRDGPCTESHSCQTEMYFTRLGADGVEIDAERRFTDAPEPVHWGGPNTDPVWTGSEFVVPWRYQDTASFHISRLGPDGTLRDEISVDDPIEAITWAGSRLGVVWADDTSGNHDVYLRFLDPTGGLEGTVQVTDDGDGQAFPNVVWTGSTYGIVWLDGRDTGCSPLPYEWMGDCRAQIYMSILDAEGTTIWDNVRITSRDSWKLFTSMTWTGSEFGLAWFEITPEPDEEWYISFDRISFCD